MGAVGQSLGVAVDDGRKKAKARIPGFDAEEVVVDGLLSALVPMKDSNVGLGRISEEKAEK